MEIIEKVEELVKKITEDPKLMEQFRKDPEKAVESIIGKDIPDGTVDKIVTAVKAKVAGDKAADALGSLKKLF